jgi:hypothetical protein
MTSRVFFALRANASASIRALTLFGAFVVLSISNAAYAASQSGTVIPQASQIVDSGGNIWTAVAGGQIYENGVQVSGGGTTIQLLYYNGGIYTEYPDPSGVNYWYSWNGSSWNRLGINGEPQPPSASGTTIPSASDIVDSNNNIWTATVGGLIALNGVQVSGGGTTNVLLYYNGGIYTEYPDPSGVNYWYSWNGSSWDNLGVNGDPRTADGLSLFSNLAPVTLVNANTTATTLGVKFWSTHSGTISAIKFYRGRKSPQGYVARLYSASGALLGSVTMAQESSSVPGWQQAVFASPIPIAANTTYVATYYAPSGQYSDTPYGLKQTVSNGPLNAPAASLVGGNGVFKSGLAFPATGNQQTNFFVDVAFIPTAQPYLSIAANPPNPTIPSTTPLGSVVASLGAAWSDGSPFTGKLSFGPPNYSDGGVYAIDGNNNLIISPSGPGVGGAGGSAENVTIVATQ